MAIYGSHLELWPPRRIDDLNWPMSQSKLDHVGKYKGVTLRGFKTFSVDKGTLYTLC